MVGEESSFRSAEERQASHPSAVMSQTAGDRGLHPSVRDKGQKQRFLNSLLRVRRYAPQCGRCQVKHTTYALNVKE